MAYKLLVIYSFICIIRLLHTTHIDKKNVFAIANHYATKLGLIFPRMDDCEHLFVEYSLYLTFTSILMGNIGTFLELS